ncbi:hypothetical protein HK101_009070 [Irineochytrium annulatum]|nr:hypothetical protein HK101_009070 [Irineochytrium annulatum]
MQSFTTTITTGTAPGRPGRPTIKIVTAHGASAASAHPVPLTPASMAPASALASAPATASSTASARWKELREMHLGRRSRASVGHVYEDREEIPRTPISPRAHAVSDIGQLSKDQTHHLSHEALHRLRSPTSLSQLHTLSVSRPGLTTASSSGLPRPEVFAIDTFGATTRANRWGKSVGVRVGEMPESEFGVGAREALQYGGGKGLGALRSAIGRCFVGEERRPAYQDWDVVITAGNTQCLDVLLRSILNRGDGILVSSLTYPPALDAILSQGLIPVPVAIDAQGLIPSDLHRARAEFTQIHPRARLPALYVVPTGQNPTGGTMGVARRAELIRVAREMDLMVMEDNACGMLQLPPFAAFEDAAGRAAYAYAGYAGMMPSLAELDTDGRVVSMCSFAKIVAPGLRLGFAVASRAMCEVISRCNEATLLAPCGVSQALVLQLINSWGAEGLDRHATDLQRHYALRRDWILDSCRAHLTPDDGSDPVAEWTAPTAGMFLWVRARLDASCAAQVHARLAERGVLVVPESHFVAQPLTGKAETEGGEVRFRVSYSYLERGAVDESIRVVAEVLREFARVSPREC